MRAIFLLLIATLLVLPLFASQYGPSTLVLEKTWNIAGEKGAYIELDGIFVINNSYQQVVSIEKTEGATSFYGENGIIKIRYNGTMKNNKQEIYAKATIDVLYNARLPNDESFSTEPLTASNYTRYSEEMEETAKGLTDSTSIYGTIRNLTDWVNKYVTYDLDYFGKNNPAQEVFIERKGVCVEYSHLLISLMKSVGLQTRYVSGYVYGREWQPHAWVEVMLPNGAWLAVDPTFDEAQFLDNSHLAVYYGKDQAEVFDKISSNKKVAFDPEPIENVEVVSSEKSKERLADIEYSFDEKKETMHVKVKNRRDEYLFISYAMLIPAEAGKGERTILMLKPLESLDFTYVLKPGYVKEGFVYNIPISIAVNDFETKYEIVATKTEKTGGEDNNGKKPPCPASLILIFLTAAGVTLLKRV